MVDVRNLGSMKSDPLQKRNYFSRSRARVILLLLGVRSVVELVRLSGVSYPACEAILYKPNRCAKTSTFVKLFETFCELYEEKKDKLDPDLRKMVKTYIRDWARYMVEVDIQTTRVGRRMAGTSSKGLRQRELRLAKRIAKNRALIKDFCG